MAYAVVGFSTLMVNGVQGRFDAQWLQRTQDRGADYLVHALGSERDATFAVTRIRATALITRRLRVSVARMGHARIRGSREWVTARGHPAGETTGRFALIGEY